MFNQYFIYYKARILQDINSQLDYNSIVDKCGEVKKLTTLIGKEVSLIQYQIHTNLDDFKNYLKVIEHQNLGGRYGRDMIFLITGLIIGFVLLANYKKVAVAFHIKI